jgi:hypothetical protein
LLIEPFTAQFNANWQVELHHCPEEENAVEDHREDEVEFGIKLCDVYRR